MKIDEVRHLLNEICNLILDNLSSINTNRYEITYKADGTPVTSADIFLEQLVKDFIQDRLQEVVFIGEESFEFSTINTEGYIAILDPIDGTENFCSGLMEWGVSFGLWKGTAHLGSLLFMPELGIKLLTGDQVKRVQSRITGLSSSMSSEVIEQMAGPGEYRIMGCAVYNLYNVIRGAYKKFINPKGANVWDILPGAMIALEHGCKVFIDGQVFDGKMLDPNKKYRIEILR